MHDGTCGEHVTAEVKGRNIHVTACDNLRAQGWGNQPQAVFTPAQVEAGRLTAAPAPVVAVRHDDGLVAFNV
jgi:hypothetical protein